MTLADVNKMIERSSRDKVFSRKDKLSTVVKNFTKLPENHQKVLTVVAVFSLLGIVFGSLARKHFSEKN